MPPRTPPPRTPTKPTVAAPTAGGELPRTGPPLKAGGVYTSANAGATPTLSDDLQRQLRLIGIEEGQKVPPGIQARIKAVHTQFLDAQNKTIEEMRQIGSTERLIPSTLNDISELPEEAREQLKREVAIMMREAANTPAETAPLPPGMSPEVGATVQWLQNQRQPEVAFVDTPTQPTPTQPTPPLRQTAAAAPPPEEPTPADDAGTTMTSAVCERCGFDHKGPAFNAEPTAHDTQAFTASILGVTRFVKEMPVYLLGTELTVTFRSLTAAETRMSLSQMRFDVMRGAVSTQAEYFMAMADYRLVLGLQSISDASGAEIMINPPIDADAEFPKLPGTNRIDWAAVKARQDTPLVERLDWFISEGLPNESLRRLVGQAHRQFQRVVETLEVRTADPNFWRGIAPRA